MWAVIRVVILLVGFLQAVVVMPKIEHALYANSSIAIFLEVLSFSVFGVYLALAFQLSRSDISSLMRPSWTASPVSVGYPVQMFHLGSYYLIAFGMGCFAFSLDRGYNWFWELPVAAGFGMRIGLALYVWTNRERFNNSNK